MKIRAVIFDVYGTLLEIGPAPADADNQWQQLFADLLKTPPPLSRTDFFQQSRLSIDRRHHEAKALGIPWPEINWPSVVTEILPALNGLPLEKRDEFFLRQMALERSPRLADHAADCLRWLRDSGIPLGIASNAQAYTLRELGTALSGAGLDLSWFDPSLRFWSFENGFSKPDPHAFRILTARLEARGISPTETLMVGDRPDNDREPARAQGWQTWLLQLRPSPGNAGGNWLELLKWIKKQPR